MDRKTILNQMIENRKKCVKGLRDKLHRRQEELNESDWSEPTDSVIQKNNDVMEYDRIKTTLEKKEICLSMLCDLPIPQTERVALNSLVIFKNKIMLILPKPPGCGACSMQIAGKEILCVSIRAPFIKEILNKKRGDTIYSCGDAYKIIDIQ